MKLFALLFVLVLFFASTTWAGTITAGLDQAYSSRSAGETLPVLIVLSDRVQAPALTDRLPRLGLSLAEIHQVVMDSLQIRSSATQTAVLKPLDILKSNGLAKDARPLWICNMISAELTRAATQLIANMAEVSEVGLDETVTQRKSVEASAAESMPAHVEDGVLQAGARDAWQRGFTGAGRILCSISDGVATSHPALSTRWKGRSGAVSQCWHDPTGNSTPASCGDEGTQMIGFLCGADAQSGDTTGVAPGATWIAARLFCGPTRLSDVFLALQWAVDPDRQSSTFGDVPDAICNAWGLESPCSGAVPESAWEAISNAEALGPVLVFAASNNGSAGASSVRAPESLPQCFAVGNADTRQASVTVAPSSGRGPSPCDHSLIKPDLVAPGTGVRTTGNSGYRRITGTAASAAYTAATVALMRQAHPNISAAEIKRLLVSSATDLGTPGADNTFGAGLLNAGRAVNLALSSGPTGTIEGVVQYGGQPLAGAVIMLSSNFGELTAVSVGGVFRFDHVIASHRYALSAGRFGFKNYSHNDSITVDAGRTTTTVINLQRGFDDDATHDQGWSLGVEGDNAASGIWVRAKPVGSLYEGRQVQPDKDAPPYDGYCFVTGNGSSLTADAMEADVSGGHTTLRSPLFSLSEISEPELKFSYWYSNDLGPNSGSDFFRAQISNNGGATWVNIINTAASTHGWRAISVPVSKYLLPTDRMLLQFIARDEGPNSLIEAAVDDISIIGAPSVPEPPRNLTMDVQFDQVLLAWRRSEGASAYRVYICGDPDCKIAPENLYTTTSDTSLTVPMKDIHFDEFYFQVTAAR